MTLIGEVLARNPKTWSIPNVGVAKVGPARSEQEWRVLQYELRSFVAEGEYEAGLDRILSSYLAKIDGDAQPAAWVSGFFGSGKSHLVKVLDALWTDLEFPDGARASSLVSLPKDLEAQFRELKTRSLQFGGAFSAAGTLSAGGTSAAISFLEIVLAAAGLPTHYPAAKLVLWLRRAELEGAVIAHFEGVGKDLHGALQDMYVSTDLANAILAADPTFAASTADVRATIRTQYPNDEQITDDEFIETLGEVLRGLGSDGQIPLTLIVLDELQQFVAQDSLRTLEVQQLVEAVSSRFGSRVLFVATGQMALSSTTALQKLQDRFTISVTLRDTDVDRVVRSVVLRKKPEKEPELHATLDRLGGEISRQLAGSAIQPTAADAPDLVSDYPLLPSRRRFWERVLREMDATGRAAKLRTQLRIILEATAGVADREVGVVVAGDAIYDQLQDEFLSSGMLPRETASLISEVDDGTPNGALQSRVSKLAFLIGRLPTEGARPSGVRATNDMIADLLIEDLATDGARMRAAVPLATAALVKLGRLDEVDGAFLLQTPTSAEWAADYELYRREVDADEPWIAGQRAEQLQAAMETAIRGFRPTQGDSKETRRFRVFYGDDEPRPDDAEIPVWVRDGWGTSEPRVVERARDAGPESRWVFVFVPKARADDLRAALIEGRAAAKTVERRATPTTEEGRQARASIMTRRDAATETAKRLIDEIVRDARVFQGGGSEVESPAASSVPAGALGRAIDNAILRLYPQFDMADSKGWARVVEQARQGSATPFAAVDHRGDADSHPVAKAVLARIAPAGTRGLEVQKAFAAPPYGWSKDAIDGALLGLTAAGHLEARLNGPVVTARQIAQNVIGSVEFRPQGLRPTMPQRMAVRALAQDLDIKLQGLDDLDLPRLIASRLHELAASAGGNAPLPAAPSVDRIRELEAEAGPAQLIAFAEGADELRGLAADWTSATALVGPRQTDWEEARRLLRHAGTLEAAGPASVTLEAINTERLLLADPDPVAPVSARLCDDLRAAVSSRWDDYQSARNAALAGLQGATDWSGLTADEQSRILAEVGLGDSAPPALGSTEDLLRSLDAVPLPDWQFRVHAVQAQAGQALARAAAKNEPAAVEVNRAPTVVRTVQDLDAFLSDVRAEAKAHIDDGKTVIL